MAQARSVRGSSAGGSAGSGEAVIGSGTRIHGRVTGEGNLTIAGTVEGEINLRGNLSIEGDGTATSDVVAHDVTVAGNLEGNVEASGAVRLTAGSRTRGTVRGATISLEEGARFTGHIECDFDLPAELGDGARAKR